jgi:hypothetical protein
MTTPVKKPHDKPCKKDPRAPHGFVRDASHSEDRYVCECEGWDPDTIEQILLFQHIAIIRAALRNAIEAFEEEGEYPITKDMCCEALIRLHAMRKLLGVPLE